MSKSFVNDEIYVRNHVRARFREHLAGANHYMFFWHCLNLNLWRELFFDHA